MCLPMQSEKGGRETDREGRQEREWGRGARERKREDTRNREDEREKF